MVGDPAAEVSALTLVAAPATAMINKSTFVHSKFSLTNQMFAAAEDASKADAAKTGALRRERVKDGPSEISTLGVKP